MRALTISMALLLGACSTAAAQNVLVDGIPPQLIGAIHVIEPARESGAWVLQVISRGGIDGRGAGDLTIKSDGSAWLVRPGVAAAASPEVLSSLGQQIRTAAFNQWRVSSRLGICSDCYTTLIVLTRRESDDRTHTYTAFWDATTRTSVPAEVLRIHDLARAIQQ